MFRLTNRGPILAVPVVFAGALATIVLPLSSTTAARSNKAEARAESAVAANWPTHAEGDSGPNVTTIELLLRSRGYVGFKLNHVWGPGTTDAVTRFQRDAGLPATGEVGNGTWPRLVVTVRRGASGHAVTALQRQLNDQGSDLVADGQFGAKTGAAVIDYKSSRCLPIDEAGGATTWHRLVTDVPARTQCFGDLPRPQLANIGPLPDGAEYYDDPCYEHGHPEDNDPKPGAVAFENILLRGFSGITNSNISRDCTSHGGTCSGGNSEHCEGRAVDFGYVELSASDDADRARVREMLRWLMIDTNGGTKCDRARALGIHYVIWDSRFFNFDPDTEGAGCLANSGKSYNQLSAWWSSAWRAYSGHPHDDHVHISITWPGARQQTAWWD